MPTFTYTPRQRDVLLFIRSTVEERGVAPTLQEIAEHLGGISRVAALDHVRALERKKAIRRKPRLSRAIEILDPQFAPAQGLPVAGRIAAGHPILEVEDREDIRLEDYLGIETGCFLLKVSGDSMIEDAIRDGDMVVVEPRRTARNGETVVAVVGDEVTLKRFYREKKRIRLQPANAALKPIFCKSKDIKIRGVVRGVLRRM